MVDVRGVSVGEQAASTSSTPANAARDLRRPDVERRRPADVVCGGTVAEPTGAGSAEKGLAITSEP